MACQWSEPVIVLGPNAKTDWESDVNRPVVIKNGGRYQMWYTGQARGHSWIGYATSQDGKAWQRMSDRPVLSADQPWEKVAVMCPHVLYDDEARLYRMWYSGGEQYEPNAIGYATSRRRPHMEQAQEQSHLPDRPEKRVGTRSRDGLPGDSPGQLVSHVLHWLRRTRTTPRSVWLDRADGITGWQRHPANPLIRRGQGKWDHDAVYKPYAILDDRRWLLWYNGRKGDVEQIGLATHDGADLGFGSP